MALGVSRFGYGLLLPAMRDDLGWSYSDAGLANAANAFGYLFGAILSAATVDRLGPRRTSVIALLLTVGATGATGLFSDFAAICVLRFLPGLTGAFVFVAGGVMAARLATESPGRRGMLIGLFYVGPGIGMAIAGLLLPAFVEGRPDLWRWGWAAAALASAAIAPLFVVAALRAPSPERPTRSSRSGIYVLRLLPALASYFVYALGMIGYLTFAVANLVAGGATSGVVTAFWVTLAVSTFPAPWLWQRLLDRSNGGFALAILCALMSLGVASSIASGLAAAFVSAVLVGCGMLSVVAATTSLVRKAMEPTAWAAGIAVFATVFGVGQTIGPWLTGVVSDRYGGLEAGLAVSGGLLALAAAIALLQKPVSASAEHT